MAEQPHFRGPNIAPTMILTLVALALVVTVSLLIGFLPLREAAQTTLAGVSGWLMKLAGDAWNYFFGTTRNSETKTQMLAAQPAILATPQQLEEPLAPGDYDPTQYGGRRE